MNQTFILVILIASVIVFLLPTLLNLLIFKHIPDIYELILAPILTASIMLFILMMLNNLASDAECKKTNKLYALKASYKTAIVIFIFYYIIILFPMFVQPIMELTKPLGHPKIFNRLGVGYYIMLASWAPLIIGYFNIIKDNCKLDKKVVDNYKKTVWDELNLQTTDKLKTVKIT